MNPETNKIFISRDVVFHEDILPFILKGGESEIQKALRHKEHNVLIELHQDMVSDCSQEDIYEEGVGKSGAPEIVELSEVLQMKDTSNKKQEGAMINSKKPLTTKGRQEKE